SLISVLSSKSSGFDVIEAVRGKYMSDPDFRTVMEKPKEFQNFVAQDGILHIKLENWTLLCIPRILIEEKSIRELIIDEAHSLLAHLGPRKTLAYLREHVWWK
ncbi:hypothetical protein F5050DRAFT_1534610, partial [Lentinula boryana]